MPSQPKTLLRMVPLPAVNGRLGANPLAALSGLSFAPQPQMVFDDDLVQIGNPANCTLRFAPVPPRGNYRFTLSGVTKDKDSGAVLGGCTVKLYTTVDDVERYQTVSDPTTGAWSIAVPSNGWTWYAVAYLAGSPDKAGTTVNTLRAS